MTLAPALRRLGAALLLSLPALPAAAGGLELSYGVWSGGARVMDLTVVVETGPRDDGTAGYRVAMAGELVGPAAWFESYRQETWAEGRLIEGRLEPEAWRTEARTDKKKAKWIALAFQDGLAVMSSDPPFSPNIRPALDEAARQDVYDPLSAILAMIQASEAAGRCAGESRVYDGRRRFDLAMQARGTVPAGLRLARRYEGTLWACAVQLTPVAGYRYDGEDKTEVSSGTVLYLAKLHPDLPRLPVRIDAETGYGGVEIHLLDIETVP